MDRVLDAGAEALESLGAQLRAGAEGLRREDQQQQQQQQQPEAEAEARRTEGQVVAADGSTTSELYGPQGLNATAPDISSSSGGSQPRRREAAATASGREEEPRQQQQQQQQKQQAPAQQQDGGEAGVGSSDGGRGGGVGGGGDGGSLGEAMRGAQERLAEESEALKQRFSGGYQPAAPEGSAAAAAEEAAAAEARPVEGFSPELQATLAEAKSRIDAETQMLKERFHMT